MSKTNDLFDFMPSLANEMERDYKRIQKLTTEDPGATSDLGENNGAEVFKARLPVTTP